MTRVNACVFFYWSEGVVGYLFSVESTPVWRVQEQCCTQHRKTLCFGTESHKLLRWASHI